MEDKSPQEEPLIEALGLPFDGTEEPSFTEWLKQSGKEKEFYKWVIAERKRVAEHSIRKAIKFLKSTPAVTLVGKGGAYELLDGYANKIKNG